MNILIISQMYPCKRHPTSAIFFANLIKELAPKVNGIIVISPRPYIPKFMTKFKKGLGRWFLDPMISKENGIEIIRPYVFTLKGVGSLGINGLLMQYSLSNLIKKQIEKRKIKVVLGLNMLPDGVAAVRLAKSFKLPVITWAIGTDINDFANYNVINHYVTKKSIEKSELVLSTSKALESKIKKISDKYMQVRTFYRGIDIRNFQNSLPKQNLIKTLQLNPDKRFMLFVGRIIYDKGIFELAQVFNTIAKRYPDFNLILLGEEFEKEKLKAKFEKYGILNRVIFKGITPYKEVACYMKISDLLVFPSWAEGLPNAIMEAMAVGLPVIATDVGGIPEIIENRVSGLLVPAKNVEKLTKAVIEMIEDKNLRELCVKNAKDLVHEKFDVRKNVSEFYSILRGVINNYGSILHPSKKVDT